MKGKKPPSVDAVHPDSWVPKLFDPPSTEAWESMAEKTTYYRGEWRDTRELWEEDAAMPAEDHQRTIELMRDTAMQAHAAVKASEAIDAKLPTKERERIAQKVQAAHARVTANLDWRDPDHFSTEDWKFTTPEGWKFTTPTQWKTAGVEDRTRLLAELIAEQTPMLAAQCVPHDERQAERAKAAISPPKPKRGAEEQAQLLRLAREHLAQNTAAMDAKTVAQRMQAIEALEQRAHRLAAARAEREAFRAEHQDTEDEPRARRGRPRTIATDNQRAMRGILMLRQFPEIRDLMIFEAMFDARLVDCHPEALKKLVLTHYRDSAIRCGRYAESRAKKAPVPQHRPCPGCAYCQDAYKPDAKLIDAAGWSDGGYVVAMDAMRAQGMPDAFIRARRRKDFQARRSR